MSRRRGEFEHRTSIFEGAFRAWSHLGGLDPEDLETKPPAELDPLTTPILNDVRLGGKASTTKNPDGSTRREYPYEPLPRSGLSHPYVQAILSPWLGPDADNEAIQLGLTTLRTWWQHRRKGESGSAIAALGTEKMKGVVEGYTRHFFTLAHCVVVNDKVQPPRGLHQKMKELEKVRSKQTKKKRAATQKEGAIEESLTTQIRADLTDPNLTPLEKLHIAQQRQLETQGGVSSSLLPVGGAPQIKMTNKCIPGKLDLPGVVDQVSRQATQLAHRGGNNALPPSQVGSSPSALLGNAGGAANTYGDPNTTPVVFVSSNGDIQIAMKVDGITCAHCVKIVETVLRGCNGNKSPIDGLLDAAADGDLKSVLIKIDRASNAKRIAFEATRNLSMVGYTAEPMCMSIVGAGADPKTHMDLGSLATAFEVVAATDNSDVFNWSIPCTCPDNGVLRGDCARHSQMNTRIFEAFRAREQQVTEYMAGCGMKYGGDCTCGPDCRCKNCPTHGVDGNQDQPMSMAGASDGGGGGGGFDAPLQMDPTMQLFGMGPPAAVQQQSASHPSMNPIPLNNTGLQNPALMHDSKPAARTQRNPSVLSYGNNGLRSSLRGMSVTSETTFGRAMSGLSALSIDWENLDDFDLEVDHSAHIHGNTPNAAAAAGAAAAGGQEHRTSLRRSIMSTGSSEGAHVSFKV